MEPTGGRDRRPDKRDYSCRTPEGRVASSVAHPLRLDILSALYSAVASPVELAQLLKAELSSVAYHVKQLHKRGAIEIVNEQPVRGAVEHFYRGRTAPEVTDDEYRAMPHTARRNIVALALQAIISEALSALRHKKLEADEDLRLAWIPMQLDEQGHREVTDLQAEMNERLQQIKAESGKRSPISEAPTRIAALMWFERGTGKALRAGREE